MKSAAAFLSLGVVASLSWGCAQQAMPSARQSGAAITWEIRVPDAASGLAEVRGRIPPSAFATGTAIDLEFLDLPGRPESLRAIRAECAGEPLTVSAPSGNTGARRRIDACPGADTVTVEYSVEPVFFPPGDAGANPADARSRITRDLGVVRTRSLLPTLSLTDGPVSVSFVLPDGWVVVTPWSSDSTGYVIPEGQRGNVEYLGLGPFSVEEIVTGGATLRAAAVPGASEIAADGLRSLLETTTTAFGPLPRSGPHSVLVVPPGFMNGGAAGARSVVQPASPEILAHELAHWWVHAGLADRESRWLTEGFVEYYGVALARRSGLLQPDDARACLADLQAEMRYLEADSTVSLLDASRRSATDSRASRLVYSKGALLAFQLETALGPGGRRLDEVMQVLVRHREGRLGFEGIARLFEDTYDRATRTLLETYVTGVRSLPELGLGEASGVSGCARFLPTG